jgi:hypothetical protein
LWFMSIALMLAFTLVFAACGTGDDDDDDDAGAADNTAPAAAATTPTGSAAEPTATEADAMTSPEGSPDSATGTAGEAGDIAACLQSNLDGDVITSLREGETEAAEAAFNTCLEEELPPALVAQLDPIVDQAVECGQTVSQDLSDFDVAAIESGDETVIQGFVNDTLTCVSDEFGVDIM